MGLSVAPNTHKAYQSAWDAYANMRSEIGQQAQLPVSRTDLILFIAHLSISGKAPSTIGSYVSGLSFLHKRNDFNDPADCFLVRKMIEGCRRDNPRVSDARRPLTIHMLESVVGGMSAVCSSVYEMHMFQAALLLAFFGFLRVSEFTAPSKNCAAVKALQIDDVSLNSDQHGKRCIKLRIRFSKTDQHGRSTTLIIPDTDVGGFNLVNVLNRFLEVRTPGKGPLFWHFDKTPMTRYQFAAILKRALIIKQIPEANISTHSIRIGACTHFATMGHSEEELMSMGRWASSAYKRYIRVGYA